MTKASNGAAPGAPAGARTPAQQAYARQLLLMDIALTWPRFRLAELATLGSRDELVARLVATYGLETPVAERELDLLLEGRTFGPAAS